MTPTTDPLRDLLDAPEAERRALLDEHPEAAGVVLDRARAELTAAKARDARGDAR